jgi:PAS domain S-box-containing protein
MFKQRNPSIPKNKKPYTPPRLIQYAQDQVPGWALQLLHGPLDKPVAATPRIRPLCTTVINSDRRYVQVSDSFCKLLGYQSEDLIGKRFDEITAPKTADIPLTFSLFKRLGYMHGLWMLVHRTGERILIRYESWLRADSFIESNIEVIDHLCQTQSNLVESNG